LVSPLGCKEFALFKSVEKNNRFFKKHCLNRLNKITDLKSASMGDPKKISLQGGNLKGIFLQGVKQNLSTLQGCKDLFTQ
jgi:hypothetical protein